VIPLSVSELPTPLHSSQHYRYHRDAAFRVHTSCVAVHHAHAQSLLRLARSGCRHAPEFPDGSTVPRVRQQHGLLRENHTGVRAGISAFARHRLIGHTYDNRLRKGWPKYAQSDGGVFGNDCRPSSSADRRTTSSFSNILRLPTSGPAPLAVLFITQEPSAISIDFGDGQIGQLVNNPATCPGPGSCASSKSAHHTYISPGTYLATVGNSSVTVTVRPATSCPTINPTLCPVGSRAIDGTDANGCATQPMCVVGQALSCSWNGQTIQNGQSVAAYQSASVPFGNQCTSQSRTCSNGTLSGTYEYASCAAGSLASCTFNCQSVAHGSSVTAYQTSSVPAGQTCSAQSRICTNGSLSGSYSYPSCSQQPRPSSYVQTSLNEGELCRSGWSSSISSGARPDDLSSPIREPLAYVWNFGTGIVRAEASLGYLPSFHPGRVSFTADGKPIVRDERFNLQILQNDGTWKSVNLLDIAKQSFAAQGISWSPAPAGSYMDGAGQYADPSVNGESRVVFDYGCNGYALLLAERSSLASAVLLHTYDGGHSWAAYKIPGSSGWTTGVSMEVPTNLAILWQPPALFIHEVYDDAGSPRTLRLVVPVIAPDKSLTFRGPFTVADHTVSIIRTGGAGENVGVSSGDLIHIAYPGDAIALDPLSGRHGTPIYVTTLSRATGAKVSGPTRAAVAVEESDASAIDAHDQPSIAIDHHGYLHLVVSGHGGPLYYLKSLQPNDSSAWSAVTVLGKRPPPLYIDEYTYPSLVIDPFDEPIVAARWEGDQGFDKLVIMVVPREFRYLERSAGRTRSRPKRLRSLVQQAQHR